MTKPRDPGSLKAGVARCVSVLGDLEIRRITGKSSQLIRLYSDPDGDRHIAMKDALTLDRVMRQAGHGSPLFEAYTGLLAETPSGRSGGCALTVVATLTAELGTTAAAVIEASADHKIDASERRAIVNAAHGLIREAQALIDTVEPRPMPLAAD